ncbi:MAG: response regulator transcription factor [Candidatus Eremiobacteraeota bacterium]|nr:response regulator transcription factor [Candidatus Eremiobacteraeota bacterium]MBV9409640.1 response regulator transcription factor [Candidatus Eremiobacteraeota bacterium]
MIGVLLADDHAEFRATMRDLLASFDDIDVLGEAQDGRDAIALAESTAPDVVLMDLKMPDLDGIEATREITQRTQASVLVLTTYDDDALVAQAIASGACGYVLKATPSDEIAAVIRLCAKGYMTLGPSVAARCGRGADDEDARLSRAAGKLSERDLEVLRLVGRGLTNREIASQLGPSEGTVRNYVSGILDTLSARNRTELAAVARIVLGRSQLR